uniref:Uncharacterized protein n=1 Tax=viral metagenome TaxID=1070528 RepID=A0A6C0DEX8_9ZZZZ
MYKKYKKTRKHKFIKNKTRNNKTKTIKENKDEYAQVLDAIMDFNYKTDWDQVFTSKQERQKYLDENIKLLRQSIDKYIQKRSENINNTIIKS